MAVTTVTLPGGQGIGFYALPGGALAQIASRPEDTSVEGKLTSTAGAPSELVFEVQPGMTMITGWFHGTYETATVKMEVSFNGGTTWMNLFGGNIGNGAGTAEPLVKSTNSTIGWEAAIPSGATHVRAHCTEFTSGEIETKLVQGSAQYETAIATNTVLASSSSPIGMVNQTGVMWLESSTVLAANATFTGTARSTGITSGTNYASNAIHAGQIVAYARSDQTGTLILEGGWEAGAMHAIREVTTAQNGTGTDFTAEIAIPVATRQYKVLYKNGATLQTRFEVNLKLNSF